MLKNENEVEQFLLKHDIDDAIYALGAAINKKYQYANGYEKFKKDLIKHLIDGLGGNQHVIPVSYFDDIRPGKRSLKDLDVFEAVVPTIYWVTYKRQHGYKKYSTDTVIDDAIYTLFVAIDKKYQYANGYEQFKKDLIKHLST